MKNLILFIKGFIFGTSNIIPGVSGGTMAIVLGVYEKLLSVFGYFLKDIKENIRFLIPFLTGIFVSVFAMSNLISYTLQNYNMVTLTFFIGLIIGGIPILYKKINKTFETKNIVYFLTGFLIVIMLSSINSNDALIDLSTTSFIMLFIVGVISSSAMVIPGLSGSFILILLGYYETIINVIKDVLDFHDFIFNISVLIFFGLGVLIGIIFISRLIKYLLDNFEIKTYYTVLGFISASIFSILNNIIFDQSQLILALLFFIIGVLISLKLGE